MSFVFNKAAGMIQQGTLNLGSDTLKVMLVTSTYIPTKDDDFVDLGGGTGISAAELNVTGYTPGFNSASRKTLANKSFAVDDANDKATFDNTADLTWTGLAVGSEIYAAVIIKEVTSDADSIPIAYLTLTTPVATPGGNFTLQFNPAGIFSSTQA